MTHEEKEEIEARWDALKAEMRRSPLKDEIDAFIAEVRANNSAAYRLHEGEIFRELQQCTMDSTIPDLQGEARSERALAGYPRYLETGITWSAVEHDPRIHPIGRILAARVFRAAGCGESVVVAVRGSYDVTTFAKLDALTTIEGAAPPHLSEVTEAPFVKVGYEKTQNLDWLLDDIANAPSGVDREPDYHLRKGVMATIIVGIATSLTVLSVSFAKSFGKEFGASLGKNLGDEAGAELIAMYRWTNSKVKEWHARLSAQRVAHAFLFRVQYRGCEMLFMIEVNTDRALDEALAGLDQAAMNAAQLVDARLSAGPDRLCMSFNAARGVWECNYLATRRLGVLTDSPQVIDESLYGGLSVDGIGSYEEPEDE